jgi:hypothetical protein
MSPELAVAIVGALGVVMAALVTAVVPLVRRATQGAVQAEGTATREAVDAHIVALNTRIDDVRDDVSGVREGITRVREWQAGHDAEHLIIGQPRPGGNGV